MGERLPSLMFTKGRRRGENRELESTEKEREDILLTPHRKDRRGRIGEMCTQ